MKKFATLLALELKSAFRSGTLAMLLVASVAWMFAVPHFVTGDGTPDGARELCMNYALGGVFALLVVTLLASATGAIAHERVTRRLALTVVRPVRLSLVPLAKACALTIVGAGVLAVAALLLPIVMGGGASRPCRHLYRPVMPTARAEAIEMYEEYMKDPNTPAAIRQAPRTTVLRLLENRAADHYFPLTTNAVTRWRMNAPRGLPEGSSVRIRFSNQFDARQDVSGVFRYGERAGVVSNVTQAVFEVPLDRVVTNVEAASTLSFANTGRDNLFVRPRKDVELLVPADSFALNLVRTYLELVAILAFVISFGLFLSASLSRPVALFVAMVVLILGEMSPSVLEQYADELNEPLKDRIGLELSRLAAEVTRPVTALNPVSRLSEDVCVEWNEVLHTLLTNVCLAPVLLALLAGFILPRKEEEV